MNTPTDPVTELTRTAWAIHGARRNRGSFSETYDSCVQQYIMVLAKEIIYLANAHDRPPARVAETAYKALSALQDAITAIYESDSGDWPSFDEPSTAPRTRTVYPGEDPDPEEETGRYPGH